MHTIDGNTKIAMSDGLPKQLSWAEFVIAIKRMGYVLAHNKRGAARVFINNEREPKVVTFHEPHKPKSIKIGTLKSYIRKLEISNEEFMRLMNGNEDIN